MSLFKTVCLALLACCLNLPGLADEPAPIYHMVTVPIVNGEIAFNSKEDFDEAMKVGFFRIKAPDDLNLEAGRKFAREFTSNPRYNQFGILNIANGYMQSQKLQSVRFSLEREYWNKCHIAQQEVDGPPNYSPELQELGHKMGVIGSQVLKNILQNFDLPEDLWFEATAGSSHGEGSIFLVFHCYDPKLSSRPEGLAAHKDWGHIALLDVTEPGLEAKIDGEWRSLYIEDGYLIVNFGYPLEKLLPGVTASEHRVIIQKEKMRTSIVLFIDPRVGPFREGVASQQNEGYIYDWDPVERKLINGESTVSFFERLSALLYGVDQSGK